MIKKDKLKSLIEPHFQTNLNSESYEIKTIKPSELLTYTRFDIAFKLLYLEMKDKDITFAEEFYEEHIRAFSLGTFTEPGDESKNNVRKFIEAFNITFEDIKNNGFNGEKTLIPLSYNGSIANGAHRVASAIFLSKDIECVQIETPDHKYDYKFFYERNIPDEILDATAIKFVEYAKNIHLAFIWPTAVGHDNDLEEIIPNIVYRKEVSLNSNGAHNLLSQIYYGEDWLGGVEDNFRGSQGKLVECFKTCLPIRVFAFQADNLNDVLDVKNKIRDIFNVGKHSIHITDTKEEAIRAARVVFNDNSIHFLNYANPNKYLSTHAKLSQFKEFMNENNLTNDEVLLDSSIILSAYGLREARDIDFLCIDNNKIKKISQNISNHDDELKYYEEPKHEMICNQKFYFYFNDLKFVSFELLYKMKRNRGENKDSIDCQMMESLIEQNKLKELISKSRQKFTYLKIRSRAKFIAILKSIGLYHSIKSLYRFISERGAL